MATATNNQPKQGVIHAGITRRPASEVILPGTKIITPDIARLRVEWARLMDSGQEDEAYALEQEIRCADTFDLAIANGLAELMLIERRALERRRHQKGATSGKK